MTKYIKPKYCKFAKKSRYPDSISAKLAIASLGRNSSRDKVPTRAYKCTHCKGYHLTSQPKRSIVVDSPEPR